MDLNGDECIESMSPPLQVVQNAGAIATSKEKQAIGLDGGQRVTGARRWCQSADEWSPRECVCVQAQTLFLVLMEGKQKKNI